MKLFPLPVLADNYVWILHNDQQAVVCDPGVSEPVVAWLQQHHLTLTAIVITHHHQDHTAGADALYSHCGSHETQLYLPAADGIDDDAFASIPQTAIVRCAEGTPITLLGLHAQIIDTPGHTAGHIVYFFNAQPSLDTPVLFCGDTLFSAGCGYLFEGTPQQMQQSLSKLANLPTNTRICCAHEYTVANLRFALTVEPDNAALHEHMARCTQLRTEQQATLPSTLEHELKINPFLRLHQPRVKAAIQQHHSCANTSDELLATLRSWKNTF